jgi:hypothetical protein
MTRKMRKTKMSEISIAPSRVYGITGSRVQPGWRRFWLRANHRDAVGGQSWRMCGTQRSAVLAAWPRHALQVTV